MRLSLFLLGLFSVSAHASDVPQSELPDTTSADAAEEPASVFLARVAKKRNLIQHHQSDSVIEVFYIEHVLASWVLQASPWNAYHSGIAFKVYDGPDKANFLAEYSIDFSPRVTSQVKYQLHPVVTPRYPDGWPELLGRAYAWVWASYDILWENEGYVRYSDSWSSNEKFENATLIGEISGTMFNEYLEWVSEYEVTHTQFEPVEIVVNHTDGVDERVRGSSMCHDLFYYSLDKLTDLGFAPSPADYIFRDHIMVFADSYVEVDMEDWATRRRVLRYFSLFEDFMVHINKEFTHIRNLLVGADMLKVTPYLYKNGKYYQVNMVPPYVNYCYLPVHMPPERASVWDEAKFCALEMQLSTNTTAAAALISLPQLLYVADSLMDDPRAWLVAVAAALLVLGRFSLLRRRSGGGKAEQKSAAKRKPKRE